jgi:hypothetical protein
VDAVAGGYYDQLMADKVKDSQTLQRERELGRTAEPCNCGLEYCTGWTFGALIGHGIGRPVGILTNTKLTIAK